MLFIKLNKEYKEEIIYETMIKMGFLYYYNDKQGNRNKYYYNSKGIQYDTDKTSVHKIYVGLFLSFDKNNILSIDMSNWLYFSEFLARHNITELTDIEPSSLIDVEHKERGYSPSFEELSNIEQKVLITFIEEFDRVYNSIGSK